MNATTKRWWRLLAVLLAFTVVSAACGDDDEGDTASQDTAGESDSSWAATDDDHDDGEEHDDEVVAELISDECAIPNPEETVELDVMGWEFPIITAFAAELEECTDGNYELNYQFLDSTEARSAMTQDAATGAPTFELYQGSNAFIGELANRAS